MRRPNFRFWKSCCSPLQLTKVLQARLLVATHNLGSVPEFCDRTVLIKGTVLDYGPTSEIFTQDNLERTFGGVLRHFVLGGSDLHDDEDERQVTVITDDERPFVVYDTKDDKQ